MPSRQLLIRRAWLFRPTLGIPFVGSVSQWGLKNTRCVCLSPKWKLCEQCAQHQAARSAHLRAVCVGGVWGLKQLGSPESTHCGEKSIRCLLPPSPSLALLFRKFLFPFPSLSFPSINTKAARSVEDCGQDLRQHTVGALVWRAPVCDGH